MLNDNGGGSREWDLRYIGWLKLQMKIFHSLRPKKLSMRDGNSAYIYPRTRASGGLCLNMGSAENRLKNGGT